MKRSESIKELAGALSKAQAVLGAPVKDKLNPHFKSTYASLASYIEAVSKPLSEHGLCFTQTVLPQDPGPILLVTTLIHAGSGEWISSEIPLIVNKKDMPSMMGDITYARRAGLGAIVGVFQDDPAEQVAADKDTDGAPLVGLQGRDLLPPGKPNSKPNGEISPPPGAIHKYLQAFRDIGVSEKDIRDAFRIDDLSKLSPLEIKRLNSIGKQMKQKELFGPERFAELVSRDQSP